MNCKTKPVSLKPTKNKFIGLTPMDFSVLIQLTNLGPRSFPLNGLQELEPEWQEMVIDIITKPPVSQILKGSTYTPSSAEIIPITFVEKPPIPIAA